MEKNWALFVDQHWLQALQFLVQLIDLLNNYVCTNLILGLTGLKSSPLYTELITIVTFKISALKNTNLFIS